MDYEELKKVLIKQPEKAIKWKLKFNIGKHKAVSLYVH